MSYLCLHRCRNVSRGTSICTTPCCRVFRCPCYCPCEAQCTPILTKKKSRFGDVFISAPGASDSKQYKGKGGVKNEGRGGYGKKEGGKRGKGGRTKGDTYKTGKGSNRLGGGYNSKGGGAGGGGGGGGGGSGRGGGHFNERTIDGVIGNRDGFGQEAWEGGNYGPNNTMNRDGMHSSAGGDGYGGNMNKWRADNECRPNQLRKCPHPCSLKPKRCTPDQIGPCNEECLKGIPYDPEPTKRCTAQQTVMNNMNFHDMTQNQTPQPYCGPNNQFNSQIQQQLSAQMLHAYAQQYAQYNACLQNMYCQRGSMQHHPQSVDMNRPQQNFAPYANYTGVPQIPSIPFMNPYGGNQFQNYQQDFGLPMATAQSYCENYKNNLIQYQALGAHSAPPNTFMTYGQSSPAFNTITCRTCGRKLSVC